MCSVRGADVGFIIKANLYIQSTINTLMNLVLLLFWGRLGRQGISEKFCDFVKVSYFWGVFFHIFKTKTNTKLDFLYVVCRVRTKKMIHWKVRKLLKSLLNRNFLGQNTSTVNCKCRIIWLKFIVLRIYNFR